MTDQTETKGRCLIPWAGAGQTACGEIVGWYSSKDDDYAHTYEAPWLITCPKCRAWVVKSYGPQFGETR